MSAEPADTNALTRTERALLRALFMQGGTCEDGHTALAQALDRGTRSLQRAASRLEQIGFLRITRRGYGRTALLQLTVAGKDAASALHAVSADTPIGLSSTQQTSASPYNRPIGRSLATAPVGFIGDANALSVARVVARISHDDSPEALARAYIEQVENTSEIVRLAGYLDDHDTLPSFAQPTGYAKLDDGLRAYFAGKARRAQMRTRMRAITNTLLPVDGDV